MTTYCSIHVALCVWHATADADSKGLLLGSPDGPLSGLGTVQVGTLAEVVLDLQVVSHGSSSADRALCVVYCMMASRRKNCSSLSFKRKIPNNIASMAGLHLY